MTYRAIPESFANIESEDGWKACTADTVTEADDAPVKTGVLDAYGVMIYRVRDVHPLGFDLSVRPKRRAPKHRDR